MSANRAQSLGMTMRKTYDAGGFAGDGGKRVKLITCRECVWLRPWKHDASKSYCGLYFIPLPNPDWLGTCQGWRENR